MQVENRLIYMFHIMPLYPDFWFDILRDIAEKVLCKGYRPNTIISLYEKLATTPKPHRKQMFDVCCDETSFTALKPETKEIMYKKGDYYYAHVLDVATYLNQFGKAK